MPHARWLPALFPVSALLLVALEHLDQFANDRMTHGRMRVARVQPCNGSMAQ
jgi:hypothetical protein